jgi:Mrp family chromosome partitioning ATPase
VLLLLVMLVIGAAAGVAYTGSQGTSYTARSAILIKPLPGNPLSPDTATSNGAQLTVAMATESGLVDIPAVTTKLSTQLGRTVPGPGEQLNVKVPTGAQIIQIEFTSTTAERAREGAAGFADTYLKYRSERAASTQKSAIDSLKKQIDTAQSDLKSASSEAVKSTDTRSYASQQVQLYADRLASLNEDLSTTQAVASDPGSVITEPSTPTSPDGLNRWLIIIIGTLLGGLLGAVLAVMRERRRDLVRAEDGPEVAGVPVFARLRRHSTRRHGAEAKAQQEFEAYRRLRAGVVANAQAPGSLAVTCVSADQSAATVASQLALSLRKADFQVALVAADPTDDAIERELGVTPGPGLSDVLGDDVPIDSVLTEAEGLTILRGGLRPASSRELYAGPRLRTVVEGLTRSHDYVIVSSAPASSADGDAATTACDSTLMIVTEGRTSHGQVADAIGRFDRLGAAVIGAAVAPAAPRRRRHAEPAHRSGKAGETVADGSTGTSSEGRVAAPAGDPTAG